MPKRFGYASGGVQLCPSFRQIHSTPFATASHGFSTRQTFPNNTCTGTRPSQKIT